MVESMYRYYKLLREWTDLITQHNYEGALTIQREGVVEAKRLKGQLRDIPSVPFVFNTLAPMLYGDFELIDQMEAIARSMRRDDSFADSARRGIALLDDIRELLKTGSLTTAEIRAKFEPEERTRVGQLVRLLDKNRELGIEKIGADSVVTFGRPTIVPKPTANSFRLGLESPIPTPLDLTLAAPPRGNDIWGLRDSPAYVLESSALFPVTDGYSLRVEHIPVKERLPGPKHNISLNTSTWLIGSSKRASNGIESTAVVRLGMDGTREKFELDHLVYRASRAAGGEHVVTIDRDLIVRLLDEHGDQNVTFSLDGSPELEIAMKRRRDAVPRQIVRAADVNLDTREILISIIDTVYRFTFEGQLVSAIQLPGIPDVERGWLGVAAPSKVAAALSSSGRSGELTMRQVASFIHTSGWREPQFPMGSVRLQYSRHAVEDLDASIKQPIMRSIGRLRVDWAYFAAFSDFDDTIWVSGYQGLLTHVTPGGNVLDSWVLPHYVTDLCQVTSESVIAATLESSSFAAHHQDPKNFVHEGGTVAVSALGVARVRGGTFSVIRWSDGRLYEVDVLKPGGTVYGTTTGFIAEVAGKRYVLEFTSPPQ